MESRCPISTLAVIHPVCSLLSFGDLDVTGPALQGDPESCCWLCFLSEAGALELQEWETLAIRRSYRFYPEPAHCHSHLLLISFPNKSHSAGHGAAGRSPPLLYVCRDRETVPNLWRETPSLICSRNRAADIKGSKMFRSFVLRLTSN